MIGPPDCSCVIALRASGTERRAGDSTIVGDSRLEPPICRAAVVALAAVLVGGAFVGPEELSVRAPEAAGRLGVRATVMFDPDVVSIVVPPALAITASPAGGAVVLACAGAVATAVAQKPASTASPSERARDVRARSGVWENIGLYVPVKVDWAVGTLKTAVR